MRRWRDIYQTKIKYDWIQHIKLWFFDLNDYKLIDEIKVRNIAIIKLIKYLSLLSMVGMLIIFKM